MRKEKKFLNSNGKKKVEDLNSKGISKEKKGSNLIEKVAIVALVLALLTSLIILMIPKIKNFFDKDTGKSVIENEVTEPKQNYEVLADGTKVNTSEEIENYEFDLNGIKFSNIKITEKDGYTDLEVDYENTLGTDIEGFGIKFNFYNSNNEIVYYYSVKLPELIKTGEKDKIYSSILEEYAGIENVKIEIDSEL